MENGGLAGLDGFGNFGDQRQVIPEFIAAGGSGIFKPPMRAAVHPHCPPTFDVRPRPSRETQTGRFVRTIACTETQLWAGQENGVRFWHYRDMYETSARVRRGDEDTAPFYECKCTSLTTCLVVDEGNRMVWTGHEDGRVRWWKMDQGFAPGSSPPFKEELSWQAHEDPVLSMVFSSYGDLWIGSEGGVIKIWPWGSLEKLHSQSSEEKHMAALLVERNFIDLRSQVTINGACKMPSSDVKFILSDHTKGRVWCAGSTAFSLWDARTRELIKVFSIEGHIQARVEMPSSQESDVEDDIKVKLVSMPKKEKVQGFLQQSRSAMMGAVAAVRSVAASVSGAFKGGIKKTECMVVTLNGMIWSGCSDGMLAQWDGNGNHLNDFCHHPSAVLSLCSHGSRLWVGYASGLVQLLDLDGNLLTAWISDSAPVVKMAVGGGFVFSLATHGGINAWHLTSPGPLDDILRTELAAKELHYTRREQFKILVGTWNVGEGKASPEALDSWLAAVASDVGIVVVSLQEMDMGAGFLAISAAKETVGLGGSSIGQWWQDTIGKTLDEYQTFERIGSRQLAGLLITIWVRKTMKMHVGDLDVAAVACGLGHTIGNKGGVGLRLRVHDRVICFVNCHFAAHLGAVKRRNADFGRIFRTMVFSQQSNLLHFPANMLQCLIFCCALVFFVYSFLFLQSSGLPLVISLATAVPAVIQALRSTNIGTVGGLEKLGRHDLSESDMVIFCGDFNYRLFGITYDEARSIISRRDFDLLSEKDQLRAEMKAGKVFQGMREAIIRFPPTYKFEKHQSDLEGYSREKKRIPSWCDRVIIRDCRTSSEVMDCSLDCPVIAAVQSYEACMDVTGSDHKPVRCKLVVHLAHINRSVRRKVFGETMKSCQVRALVQEYSVIPEILVSKDSIVLQNHEMSSIWITNKSTREVAFIHIQCEGPYTGIDGGETSVVRPRGSFGFPNWLEVSPAVGIIYPDRSMEVRIYYAGSLSVGDLVEGIPHSRWLENVEGVKAILRINVRASASMEVKTHRVCVCVRRSYSSNFTPKDSTRGIADRG